MKKVISLLLAAIMLIGCMATLAACGGNGGEEGGNDEPELKGLGASPLPAATLKADFQVPDDFKIGFIFLHDEKSTYDANFMNAAKEVKELLGLTDSQCIMRYPINEEEECPEAAEYLAEQGCKIIFADSFGHENGLLEVAAKYPEIQFCHATGTRAHTCNLPNMHNAFANIYEGRFLAGIAAGMKLNEMIKAGTVTEDKAVIGYVGAFPYAEVVSGFTSFFLGARSVCPSATMKVNFTNSWFDVDKERQNALALINDGCVLISQHADSMGAPSACEENGVPNVSYNGSTYEDCPESFIVSSRIDWAPYFLYIIDCVVNGKEIAVDWCGGLNEGSVVLSDINLDVAAEGTTEAITKAIADLKAGKLHVFDTSTFTVNGAAVTTYLADVDDMGDYVGETEVIKDGYFAESEFRSAPYFDLAIDGITRQ